MYICIIYIHIITSSANRANFTSVFLFACFYFTNLSALASFSGAVLNRSGENQYRLQREFVHVLFLRMPNESQDLDLNTSSSAPLHF